MNCLKFFELKHSYCWSNINKEIIKFVSYLFWIFNYAIIVYNLVDNT